MLAVLVIRKLCAYHNKSSYGRILLVCYVVDIYNMMEVFVMELSVIKQGDRGIVVLLEAASTT